MGRQLSSAKLEKLALALAAGANPTAWARKNGFEPRSARNWARLPECRAMVESHRERIVSQTIGTLVRHAVKSVRQIAKLAETGEPDAVKLSAAKTLLDKLVEIQTHATTIRTLNEVSTRLDNLEKTTDATNRQTS
jgi:hypothetical protein